MTQLSVGHFLRLYNDAGTRVHSFQNFFIGENVTVASIDYILELKDEQVKEILGVYHDYSRDIAMG